MSLSEKKEKKQILKKHVNSIHCSNNLTLVQRKLFNAFLINAYHDLPKKSVYEISVTELCQLIGYESRERKKLKKSILDLITTSIEWNIIDQESGDQTDKWRASAIISAAKIEDGVCTYEFSSVMRELLYTPEMYGRIDVRLMVEFKSSYGLALYENCIRYQGLEQTQWLSLDVFRKLMGIPESKYKNFYDLKKRVLDIAVKEVNRLSPIHVIPEIRRINRNVTSIRFKLSSKKIDHAEGSDNELHNILIKEFSLSAEVLGSIFNQYGQSYIKEKINLIKNSDSYKSGKIRGLAAYFIDSLKKDYKPNQSSNVIAAQEKFEKEQSDLQAKKNEEDDLRRENENNRKRVEEYWNRLSDKTRDDIMISFEKYLKEQDSFYSLKKYKESGIESPAIRAIFNSYVKEMMNSPDVCVIK